MTSNEGTVLLIDDDADVRDAVARLLRSAGWLTRGFASAQEFLAEAPVEGPGCVLLDISMPGMTGPELHGHMRAHGISLPVIFLSGNCDVPVSVQAMKHGAVDVLQKPADADTLLAAVQQAVDRHRIDDEQRQAKDDVNARLGSLSPRERQVLDHVIVGQLNKQIAGSLGIAEKTVKVHRGRAMSKMRVRSVAELVDLCGRVGIRP